MTSSPTGMIDLLRRLKERKLGQWVLAYLAGAWLVLQVLDVLAGTYGWPAAAMRAVPVLLAGGVLVVVVIAWYHGEKGRQRVSGLELTLLATILVFAGAVVGWVGPEPAGDAVGRDGAAADARSVAVLPFVNTSGDPAQEYFADGITEEILVALAQLPDLHVPARTSSFYFKGKSLPMREIARQLSVSSVLEGSVLKMGNQVRIIARLVDGTNDRQLWSKQFNRTMDDVFAVQSEIAQTVAAELRVRLRDTSTPARRTSSAAAHDLYLQGLFHWNRRTGQDIRRAIQLFDEATDLDPDYADAHAGLALVYAVLPLYTTERVTSHEAVTLVERAARRALELDSTLARPHAALGYTYQWVWRWEDAGREFERAVTLNPIDPIARQWYGEYLAKTGRADEGVAQGRRAVELDPLSVVAHGNLGVVLAITGRNSQAIEQLERTRAMDPSLAFPHAVLHKLYLVESRWDDALEAGRNWAQLSGLARASDIEILVEAVRLTDPAATPANGASIAARAAALDVLRGWEQAPAPLWLDIVFHYSLFGENDRAIAAIQRGVQQRAPLIFSVVMTPWFDGVRRDPRFEQVIAPMKF